MSESFIVLRKPVGALGAALEAKEAVGHGAISPEHEASIIKAARLQSGSIDPKAVELIEGYARQFGALAAKIKETAALEAAPVVKLSAYVPQTGRVEQSISHPARDAIQALRPVAFATGTTVIATKPTEAGGTEAIVSVHNGYMSPDRADAHYLVTFTPGQYRAVAVRVRVEA